MSRNITVSDILEGVGVDRAYIHLNNKAEGFDPSPLLDGDEATLLVAPKTTSDVAVYRHVDGGLILVGTDGAGRNEWGVWFPPAGIDL